MARHKVSILAPGHIHKFPAVRLLFQIQMTEGSISADVEDTNAFSGYNQVEERTDSQARPSVVLSVCTCRDSSNFPSRHKLRGISAVIF